MIQRRNALRGSGGKMPNMTEESGMRHFIEVRVHCATRTTSARLPHQQNPAFLEGGSDFPPLNINLVDMACRTEKINETEDLAVCVTEELPPIKRRKIVRFADE